MLRAIVDAPATTRRVYSHEAKGDLDLSELPLQVLAALVLEGPLGVAALAERLALSKGSVSSTLKRLRDAGLAVEVAPRDMDRRRKLVNVSEQGRAVVERLAVAAEEALRDFPPASSDG